MAIALGPSAPSPGTPGEGWGEGSGCDDRETLILTLSRRAGRGNRNGNNPPKLTVGDNASIARNRIGNSDKSLVRLTNFCMPLR